MSTTRSIPLTALALAAGLMVHGTTTAQDHAQHKMPPVQDHSQHQPAKKPIAKKKAPAPATRPANASHAGHTGHAAPAAAKPPAKTVATPAKKKGASPTVAPHAGHGSAPAAKPAAKPAPVRKVADPHAGMAHGAGHGATDAPAAAMDHSGMDHSGMDHSGMDHGAMPGEMPPTQSTPAGMDHGAMDHDAMDHGAKAHHETPARLEPVTPIPELTDADRAAAFPELQRHMEHAPERNSFFLLNRLEAWKADPGRGQAWEALAWIGTDTDRLWLRSEGERTDRQSESADLEVLYGRSISSWWDVVGGVKHDFKPGPSRTWAALGLQGLSPYKFEVQATAYLGESGQTAANFEAEYETLWTNRLIMQSLVEVNLFGQTDERRHLGSGLSTVEAGLRLRYEYTRKFAPYIGVVRERAFGGTADFRRAEGEDIDDTRMVAGLRLWF